jgi:hypothetical protein
MNKLKKKLLHRINILQCNSTIQIVQDEKLNFNVYLDIGPFEKELDAVHMASFIYATKSIDFGDLVKPHNTTLH